MIGGEEEARVRHVFQKKIDIGVITSRVDIIDREGSYALLGLDAVSLALVTSKYFTVFASFGVERIIRQIHFFFLFARFTG